MRNKIVAALLAIMFGTFGIHKFYLGETGMGILYLLFSWTFIPTIASVIDCIIYLTMPDEKFDRIYN